MSLRKDEAPVTKKKSSRSSSGLNQSTNIATGSPTGGKRGTSPSTSQGLRRLGSSPKGPESPLKQALVVHHANVQHISVNWFKLITEQMDTLKRSETDGTPIEINQSNEKCSNNYETDSHPALNFGAATAKASIVTVDSLGKIKIGSRANLINPGEVRVTTHTVQGEPKILLTPNEDTESLRRIDLSIWEAMHEKKTILSQLFEMPRQDLEQVSDSILENKAEITNSRFLVLAAIMQADRLLDAINSNLQVVQTSNSNIPNSSAVGSPLSKNATESVSVPKFSNSPKDIPAVPCRQLGLIIPALLKHLSSILHRIKDVEDELKVSRVELVRCKSESGAFALPLKESPSGSVRNALSVRSSQSDDAK